LSADKSAFSPTILFAEQPANHTAEYTAYFTALEASDVATVGTAVAEAIVSAK
jgi:hypothetical protein